MPLDLATILDKTVETFWYYSSVFQPHFPISMLLMLLSCENKAQTLRNNIELGEREIKYFYLLVSQDILWVKFES